MNRLFILFSFSAFILISGARADTPVSGPISANTTWTKANSPYIVTGTVLVEQGVTLTIEPGVVAKFDSAVGMRVDGEIIAIGTESDSIRFTANTDNPSAGYWGGIQLTETAVPTTLENDTTYVSGSTFQYCVFEYSGAGRDYGGALYTPYTLQGLKLLVTHCLFSNNSAKRGAAIYGHKNTTINNCNFSNNNSSVWGGAIYGHEVIITNCSFSNNNSADHGGGAICGYGNTINNCIFNDNNSANYRGGAIQQQQSLVWWRGYIWIRKYNNN